MENEDWKSGGEAVFRGVSEWGEEVLGQEYALVRNGPYGPHCLVSEAAQWFHLDSAHPFISGLDVTLDSHTIAIACYNLLLPLLCAVAVHHSPNGQHKTIFRSPAEGFKTSEFFANLFTLVKKEDREGVFRELGNLATQLQEAQRELGKATPRKAVRGDAVIFPSDVFHAGAAPVVALNGSADDFPRVTSYMQFVPKVVVENKEWWPLLRTLYDSEHVFDRRTMAGPTTLVRIMLLHGEDPLVGEQAQHWLDALTKGRVNCIQS